MRVIRETTVGTRKVLIKELTLAEIRVWLADASKNTSIDLVDMLFSEVDVLITDIPSFTDLTIEDLGELAPSEIEPIVTDVREVNSRFFAAWQRRLAEARKNPGPISLPGPLPA